MKIKFSKYKIFAIFGIITILVIILASYIVIKKYENISLMKEISENDYYTKYNSFLWKIDKNDDNGIKFLSKKNGANLNILIKQFEDDLQYSSNDEILDNILYIIQKQNVNCNLLNEEETLITKENYNGYKILYEENDNLILVTFYRLSNKIIVFIYESNNKYFDILLDSVNNIIYNFELKYEKYELEANLNINTVEMDYTEDNNVIELLNETKKMQIIDDNYKIDYTIPSAFVEEDSENNFQFDGLGTGRSITLEVKISNYKIYEYLDNDIITSIYKKNKAYYYKEEYKESVNIIDKDILGYIYKNSYTDENKCENIEIIYEISRSYIISFIIKAKNVGLPKELIDMININNIE